MNNFTTQLLRKETKLPTKYDFEKILLSRQPLNADTKELEASFRRTEKGIAGEKKLVESLQKFGREHWVVFQNVWLNHYGHFEIDLVLQTQAKYYLFEVKNYEGGFSYQDGVCYLNRKKLAHNPIAQTQRAHVNFQNICQAANFHAPVETILLFANEFSWLDELDEIKDLTVVTTNQLKHLIYGIGLEEDKYQNKPLNSQKLIKILGNHAAENPFLPKPLTENELANLRKGIACKYCGNFDTRLTNLYMHCPHRHRELRREAISRTICEYGVLHYDQPLHSNKLADFFGEAVSHRYISRFLRENFDRSDSKGKPVYINKKQPFYKISQ